MFITLLKGCCTKGIKELTQVTRTLDLKGIPYEMYITRKTGTKGSRILTIEQQKDDKVYVQINKIVTDCETFLKEIINVK